MITASTRSPHPNNKTPGRSGDRRVRRTLFRPDLAIPRQVAPQQSPPPFHQAPKVYRGHDTNRRKFQNRPNAPPGSNDLLRVRFLVKAVAI
jgi:hypothetical protein